MPGGRHVVTAVITDDSVKRLGLAEGLTATSVFKASSVFLAAVE
jgi:molybdate transport system regulatory protein